MHTPDDVQSGVAEAQKGGRKSVLLLVASVQGGSRFVAVDIGADVEIEAIIGRRGESLRVRPPAPVAASPPTLAAGADPIWRERSFTACAFSSSRTIWKPSVIWCKG